MHKIKAVLFDIDGVLIDSKEANKIFYQQLVTKAGYPTPNKKALNNIQHRTAKDTIAFLTGETDTDKLQYLWNLLPQIHYPVELMPIMPNAQTTVRKLKEKGYQTGLVTSRIQIGVEHFFEVFGMKDRFDTVVAFENYTHPKPNPEPLIVALNRLSTKPKQAVYVGDSVSDREAASAAGVAFIGYNNSALSNSVYVNDLLEIIPFIENLSKLKKN